MDVTTFTSFTTSTLSPTLLLAAITPSQIFMALAAVVVLTVIMRSTGKRVQASRHSGKASAAERYQELTAQSNMTRDVGEVMQELDQLARQVNGQMDTRFAKLEIEIRDADQRIATLTKLLQHPNTPAQSEINNTSLIQHAPDHTPIDITLESENPYESAESSAVLAIDPLAGDHRHQKIYTLSDSGLSSDAIAQKVGQTTGEVELILALRKTRQQASVAKNTLTE